jgi:hypothetical protein
MFGRGVNNQDVGLGHFPHLVEGEGSEVGAMGKEKVG